jgi:hypothetical protein
MHGTAMPSHHQCHLLHLLALTTFEQVQGLDALSVISLALLMHQGFEFLCTFVNLDMRDTAHD